MTSEAAATKMSDQQPIHQGISWLRWANRQVLRDLDRIIILCNHSEPLAVVIPYELYMTAQDALRTLEKAHNGKLI